MICPFGEDDDDFDLNCTNSGPLSLSEYCILGIIDRNIQVAYQIVDDLHQRTPPIGRDAFWGQSEPALPYTHASIQFKKEPFVGSTTAMKFVAFL